MLDIPESVVPDEVQRRQVADLFRGMRSDGVRVFVPGRIELIGQHVDYAGGSSLTVATRRGLAAVAGPIQEPLVRVRSALGTVEIPLNRNAHGSGWEKYAITVVRRVVRNVPGPVGGAEVVIRGNLPPAAGMSSSSALVTALFLAWGHAAGWIRSLPLSADKRTLAEYLSAVENGRPYQDLPGEPGVGTLGGSQDHTAVLCSESGQIKRYRYLRPALEGQWAWPSGTVPVVLDSGVQAEKSGDRLEDYNRASRLSAVLFDNARRSFPDLPALGFLTPEQCRELAGKVNGVLLQRLRAFEWEMAAVEDASASLDRGDTAGFAAAINVSQEGAERLLGNQIPQTVQLARAARQAGALCAKSFGAGFGGAVWALVAEEDTAAFADRVRQQCAAGVFVEAPGPGAFMLDGREVWPA